MSEVKRKKGESFEALLRRYNRRVQQSGRVLQAKKIRYHSKQKSKNQAKASTLRGLGVANKREWMIKTGLLIEDRFGFKKKR